MPVSPQIQERYTKPVSGKDVAWAANLVADLTPVVGDVKGVIENPALGMAGLLLPQIVEVPARRLYHSTLAQFDQLRPLSHAGTPAAAHQRLNENATNPDYWRQAGEETARAGDAQRIMKELGITEKAFPMPVDKVDPRMPVEISMGEAFPPYEPDIIDDLLAGEAPNVIPLELKAGKAIDLGQEAGEQHTILTLAEDLREAGAITVDDFEEIQGIEDMMINMASNPDGTVNMDILGEQENVIGQRLSEILEDNGIDYIDYKNMVEDAGSTSTIIVNPQKSARTPWSDTIQKRKSMKTEGDLNAYLNSHLSFANNIA